MSINSETFAPDMLKGKTAFMTGGTSGIGLGIAKVLAAHGAQVAVMGRDAAKASNAAVEIGAGALGLAADVRDYAALDGVMSEAQDRMGPFDIVIACAAGNFLAPAAALSANAFKAVVDIDLLGSFNCLRAAYGRVRKPGASMIAVLAGQATRAMPLQAHACAAKAGVAMLVKCLAMEWGPEGIRVNGLTPGPVEDTEGFQRLMPPGMEEKFRNTLPLRRAQRMDEITAGALFLCSPAASYVSGTAIECEGATGLAPFPFM